MTDTSFDEARRCPKCQEPGKEIGKEKGRFNSTIHTIKCENSRCRWYDTTYVIQVNADGTIPPPETNRQKLFPALPKRSDESINKEFDDLLRNQLR